MMFTAKRLWHFRTDWYSFCFGRASLVGGCTLTIIRLIPPKPDVDTNMLLPLDCPCWLEPVREKSRERAIWKAFGIIAGGGGGFDGKWSKWLPLSAPAIMENGI